MIKKNIENLSNFELLELFRAFDSRLNYEIELVCSVKYFLTTGIKALVDLGDIFLYRIEQISNDDNSYFIKFKKLNLEKNFHKEKDSVEKYGVDSEFFNINKIEKISFLYYYLEALKFVDIGAKNNILNIGINKADEFLVIKEFLNNEFSSKKFVGIDYSLSAIEYAKKEFLDDENVELLCADINSLEDVNLGRFDLLISIGTLQSSNINFNAKFMELYQNHLKKDGAVILGFPNCRWIDGEMIYGAKAPNYSFNEMSLVLKDIHFCKKYLQQKGYRVVVTGKEYLFLSARKIGKN
jgi:hypothetical protein